MTHREKVAGVAGFTMGAIAMGFLIFSILAITQTANAEEFLGGDVSVWVGGEHVNEDQASVMLGASLEWRQFTLRFAHGVKSTEYRAIGEPEWEMDEWQSGTNSAILWHPTPPAFFRPHLIWRHASDITRGRPFNDKNEPTSDFFGAGFTLAEPDERIEFDFEYGLSARECALFNCSHSHNKSWQARVALRIVLWK